MILIFLSWIYIFFTAVNFGILFKNSFKIKDCDVVITKILGLFFCTIITCFVAFFIRINIEFYLLVLCLNLFTYFKYKAAFIAHLKSTVSTFGSFKIGYKTLYTLLFFVILAQSSTKPYLIDNETYYIQTIKWINEFGFVKGLANVHMFLGQNSSWHVLQAGINFPFASDFFNDLNGFLFAAFNFFAIKKLNDYDGKNIQSFAFGLVLLFTLFFMQFVNAPSPDLIIFLITPYVFFLFITHFKNMNRNDFKIILSLILFLCFVKVTMAILLVLLVILFINNYNILKKGFWQYTLLCAVVLGLFISKNAIISGYLFYPISQIDVLNVDWKAPKPIIEFYKLGTYLEGMSNVDVSQLGLFEKIKVWLTLPKLDGLFNKAFVLLLIVFPGVIYRNKNKSSLLVIYVLAVIQLIILWFASPQYRFYFVFVCFLAIQLLVMLIKSKRIGLYLVSFSAILSAIPVFITVDLNAFTTNNFAMELNTFKLKNIVIPEKNTKTETEFTKHNINGFEFNSPSEDTFFWATGNGELPCVNKKQIEYIKHYYNYVPQKRTDAIKDGFKSVFLP